MMSIYLQYVLPLSSTLLVLAQAWTQLPLVDWY